MIGIFKTEGGSTKRLETIEPDSWINLTYPTEQELELVCQTLSLDSSLLRAALDEEETSRVDAEDGQTLLIIDLPWAEKSETAEHMIYSTLPLGILLTEEHIVTVCLKESAVLKSFELGTIRQASTQQRTAFLLRILLQVAKQYLAHLRQIDKMYNHMERQLYRSQRNKELIQLLDLEKSLVYFSTSLKANEVTIEKILRGRIVKLYEDDHDLLEDVLIEIRQAIEMANIYSSIISGMMDAFASVISNNLNVTMKTLTSVTILLTLPNIIFGFYGMNVLNLPFDHWWWFPLVLAGGIIMIAWAILKKKDLF